MVGRLVEKEDVRPSQGQRREDNPRLLPAGELGDRNEVLGPVQSELSQHLSERNKCAAKAKV